MLVGFTTNHGTVTAASDWGLRAERKFVRYPLKGSFEELFHAAELESRAGQYKYLDIERAAAHLHGMIDAKSAAKSAKA